VELTREGRLRTLTVVDFATGEFPFSRKAHVWASLSDEAFTSLENRGAHDMDCRQVIQSQRLLARATARIDPRAPIGKNGKSHLAAQDWREQLRSDLITVVADKMVYDEV
jgi:hypothetical protein